MKEFVEKLIGRLEEEKLHYFLTIANTGDEKLDAIYEAVVNAIDTNILIVNQLAEEYNNGWIACSERLPETYEYVLVWCKGRFIDGTHVGEECEWYGIGVRYGKKWTVHQCKDIRDIEVLAWMLLPAQYQKGE